MKTDMEPPFVKEIVGKVCFPGLIRNMTSFFLCIASLDKASQRHLKAEKNICPNLLAGISNCKVEILYVTIRGKKKKETGMLCCAQSVWYIYFN